LCLELQRSLTIADVENVVTIKSVSGEVYCILFGTEECPGRW
jgi:hypothetical protein